MSQYKESIIALIAENDGNAPDNGVPLLLPAEAYAAYGSNSESFYTVETFDDWYSDAEDDYQGDYESDEEFAEAYAEATGYINANTASWPNNHIDWEAAAAELMHDFTEIDGFYWKAL